MLTPEMNDRLTRVGPATPCGELMRRYWIPIAPVAQLDENPVRKVRVLGEDLVLYRNTKGGLGLIGDRCLHRLVDLKYGIPDERGLRCPYHGWLYGETGKCLERPMEASPEADIGRSLKGYPVEELGGLVFAYLGPLPAPALPRWDLFVWPNAIRQIAVQVIDCNWLQCQENTGDPTHSMPGPMDTCSTMSSIVRDKPIAWRTNCVHTIHTRKRIGVGIKEIYASQTRYGFRKGVKYSKDLGADEDETKEHSDSNISLLHPDGQDRGAKKRIPNPSTHGRHPHLPHLLSGLCGCARECISSAGTDVDPLLHASNI